MFGRRWRNVERNCLRRRHIEKEESRKNSNAERIQTGRALGASVALAQQDPIKERKALMKNNADQAKIGAAMVKGEEPFDLAKAQKIFAAFEDTATKAPALFPENSIDQATADDPYTAKPEIWQNRDDFKARLAKFGNDAKAASTSVKDLNSFKAAFANIGKNDCGG
jgi:cytochrome c556